MQTTTDNLRNTDSPLYADGKLDELDLTHPNHPARIAAKVWKKMYPTSCYDDLEQEGLTACIKAERRNGWSEAVGVPKGAYMYAAAWRAISRYVKKERRHAYSPVVPENKLDDLFPVVQDTRAATVRATGRNQDSTAEPHDASPNALSLVMTVEWSTRVRKRLKRILKDGTGTDVVLPILLEKIDAQRLAAKVQKPVRSIYWTTQRARRRISGDTELWRLWSEGA